MNEVDELLLVHFGKKGMKWGVRRGYRNQALTRAGVKGGAKISKARALGRLGPVDLIRGRGVTGGAKRKAVRVGAQLSRQKAGKSTAMDLVKRYGSTRASDLIPVKRSNVNKKTGVRADYAVVAVAGSLIAAKIIASQVSKRL